MSAPNDPAVKAHNDIYFHLWQQSKRAVVQKCMDLIAAVMERDRRINELETALANATASKP